MCQSRLLETVDIGSFLKSQNTQIKKHKDTNLCHEDTEDTNFWLSYPLDYQKFVSDTNTDGISLWGQIVVDKGRP